MPVPRLVRSALVLCGLLSGIPALVSVSRVALAAPAPVGPALAAPALAAPALAAPVLAAPPAAVAVPRSRRSDEVLQRVRPSLELALSEAGLRLGSRVFLRILKEEGRLEAFVLGEDGVFSLFRSYPICAFSGVLGPKTRTGDRQAPEGFYFVPPGRMNPSSSFHLSFDLGYPNAFDRAHDRTGAYLMVHGDCASIGCYAMTDEVIEELWVLMDAAFASGQPFVRVHAFPFAMTAANLAAHAGDPNEDFWGQLAEGWRAFERGAIPPEVTVKEGRYLVQAREEER